LTAQRTSRDRERPVRARTGGEPVPHAHHALVCAAYGAVAVAALVVGSVFGKVHGARLEPRVVLWSATAVFVLAGVTTTRRLARWLGHAVGVSPLPASGAALRLTISIAGYVIILFAALGLISVPIDHLLVGGAVTGVVLGIAAQQVLGNVFAGVVLLVAHPFSVGNHIRVRSGALGGQFDGVVRGMNLTYVTLRTEEGTLHVPNSAMLAAAVGPWKKAALSAAPAPAPTGGGGANPIPAGSETTTPR